MSNYFVKEIRVFFVSPFRNETPPFQMQVWLHMNE